MVNSGSPLKNASLSALLSGLMADKSSETKALHCAKAFLDRAGSMLAGKAMWCSLTMSLPVKKLASMHRIFQSMKMVLIQVKSLQICSNH